MWYVATLFGRVKSVSYNLDSLKFDCPNELKSKVRISKGYGPFPSIGSKFQPLSTSFSLKDPSEKVCID